MGLIQKQYNELKRKIKKSEIENQRRAFRETRTRQKQNLPLYEEFEKAKEFLKQVRSSALGDWHLLRKAITRLEGNQFRILQAKDGQEACEMFLKEIGEERLVVKSKSNLSKEIGLTPFLTDHGIEVIETDIGDRINQLIGGRSSHYTGPIVHLTRYEIAEILSRQLKKEIPPIPEQLMQAVREDIESYLQRSRIGITGANGVAAKEGAILIVHNEGNITRVRSRPKHIVLASIDKIYPDLQDALLMAKLETFLATGSLFPSFIDIVGGRSKSSDVEKIPFYGMHDPRELVLILLDNGRKEILENKKNFSDLLYCIGCGNCLLDCPTYNSIGAFFGVEGMLGGRGVALSSLLRGLRDGIESGLFLCTTCGLCGEVCPVGIDAGKRIKELRKMSLEDPILSKELAEVNELHWAIDHFRTPYGEMPRLTLPSTPENSSVVLFIGCVGLTIEQESTLNCLRLLKILGIEYSLIDEVCCEGVKEETGSLPNRDRIQQNLQRIKEKGGKEVLFLCPTCLRTFLKWREEGPTGLVFETLMAYLNRHFSFYSIEKDEQVLTYHDPCHLGRGMESFDESRRLLKTIESHLVEMEHHHRESLCCGGGGGMRGFYPKFSREIARRRIEEAMEVKADLLLTDCLNCKHNLSQGLFSKYPMKVMTTPEYLLKRIEDGTLRFSKRDNRIR